MGGPVQLPSDALTLSPRGHQGQGGRRRQGRRGWGSGPCHPLNSNITSFMLRKYEREWPPAAGRAVTNSTATKRSTIRRLRWPDSTNSASDDPGTVQFSWTLDCERVLAGGVSRYGRRPETPPGPAVAADCQWAPALAREWANR